MTQISYLLPTNRQKSNPEVLQQALNSINTQQTKYDYEILIYSQDEISGDHIKWIKEDKPRGPIYGINLLAKKYAQGDYFVVLTDDQRFLNSIDLCINMLESDIFNKNRKLKICGLGCGNPCNLSRRGTRMGNVKHLQEDWPQANILRFPVIHRDVMNNTLNGFIFHPEFYHAAGDIWLGYYLASIGEPCIEGPTQIMPIQTLHDPSYEIQDCDTAYALITNFRNGYPNYVDLDFYEQYRKIRHEYE